MDITFDIDLDDVAAFNVYSLDHLPYGKKLVTSEIITRIVLVAVFMITGLVLFFHNYWFSGYFFLLSMVMVINIFFIKSQTKKRLVKHVKKLYSSSKGRNSYIGKHTLSITPETIKDIHESGESTTHWDIVYGVVANSQNIFIILNPKSSAFVIPRKAFADDTSFNQFAETAKQYHQAALAKAKTA